MNNIKLFNGEEIPLEMHKVKIVQKLELKPINKRLKAIQEAGNNTFLLKNRDVFLDMLTDSGVNAMSNKQQSAMLNADDCYAGGESFFRLEIELQKVFKKKFFVPAHQGRACEHLLSRIFVKKGNIIPMNYHFTTTKAHIRLQGGDILEIPIDEAFNLNSECLFKGNIDVTKLKTAFKQHKDKIPFVRLEAGTNLMGGQPISLQNIQEIHSICKQNNVPLVFDASLLQDNLFFIKTREESCKHKSILEICNEIASNTDIIYFSARKLGSARGGGICLNDEKTFEKLRELVPLFEGFLTYGGMSDKEMEATAVGIRETMDFDMISQGPQFIKFMIDELNKAGVPVVTPAGGLGGHLNAKVFLQHVKPEHFQAASLASALYIISGIRGMERGTMAEERNPDGTENISAIELVRLAVPRRVFTMSQLKFVVDRVVWLHKNKDLIGGLKWKEEPKILRFFFGKLEPISDWQTGLVEKFKQDFTDSL
ncbi:MAG: tryptophanase [Methanobacteriaceae archaeon]|jgi:tryptophanase|nr:tryptophanase [Candidatus Methanorudis spinitermitis]